MGSCASTGAEQPTARQVAQDRENAPNDITLLFRSGVKPPSSMTVGSSTFVDRVALEAAGRSHIAPTQTSSSGDTTRRHQRPLVGAHFTTIASAANGSLEVHSQRSNLDGKPRNLGTVVSGPLGRRGTTTAHTFDVPNLMRASISTPSRGAARPNAAPLDEEIDASYHASHGDAFDDSENCESADDMEHGEWGGAAHGDGLWTAGGGGGATAAAPFVGPRAATVSPPSPQRRIRTRDGTSSTGSVTFLEDDDCPRSHSYVSTRSSESR